MSCSYFWSLAFTLSRGTTSVLQGAGRQVVTTEQTPDEMLAGDIFTLGEGLLKLKVQGEKALIGHREAMWSLNKPPVLLCFMD